MKSKLLFCLLMTVLLITGLAQAQQPAARSRALGYLDLEALLTRGPPQCILARAARGWLCEGKNIIDSSTGCRTKASTGYP